MGAEMDRQAYAPSDLYGAFEATASTMCEFDGILEKLYDGAINKCASSRWVFRGVQDATYGFHSSLFRRAWWTEAAKIGEDWRSVEPPDERSLAEYEKNVLAAAHRAGLHDGERGRLSVLRQLALMQHHHAPTRLIDVSFNVWVALWFATEASYARGSLAEDNADGRLFIIDVTDHLINESETERDWEDSLTTPWIPDDGPVDWTTQVRAWKPANVERRIAAQHGAFLFGGVPHTHGRKGGRRYPKTPVAGQKNFERKEGRWLDNVELRTCTSVPLRFHKTLTRTGSYQAPEGSSAAYTIRIAKELKPEIRTRLRKLHGFEAATIYPDVPGFGRTGTAWIEHQPR